MTDFFTWLSSNFVAASILIVAFGIVVVSITLMYFVAFFQGREISFWPPKIGARPDTPKRRTLEHRTSSMEGYWLQELEGFADRPYSIGRLHYDHSLQQYTFDGKNYHADGSLVCTWDSIHVHIDLANRIISYIFRAFVKGELHASNYGFGIMNLKENEDGELVPVDGHFIDSQINASPQSFTLKRLEEIEKSSSIKKTDDIDAYHSALIREFHFSHHEHSRKS